MLYTVQTVWSHGAGECSVFSTLKQAQKFARLMAPKCSVIIWDGQAGGMRLATFGNI